MNILSIDYGDARIGLAHGTDELNVAFPLEVLANTGTMWDDLDEIIRGYDIEHILVGLPINLESKDTIQTEKVRDFVDQLRERFDGDVELCDERMTSALAMRYLEKGQSIDVESARILLEEWLEKHAK